jgi:hypothetical protein
MATVVWVPCRQGAQAGMMGLEGGRQHCSVRLWLCTAQPVAARSSIRQACGVQPAGGSQGGSYRSRGGAGPGGWRWLMAARRGRSLVRKLFGSTLHASEKSQYSSRHLRSCLSPAVAEAWLQHADPANRRLMAQCLPGGGRRRNHFRIFVVEDYHRYLDLVT